MRFVSKVTKDEITISSAKGVSEVIPFSSCLERFKSNKRSKEFNTQGMVEDVYGLFIEPRVLGFQLNHEKPTASKLLEIRRHFGDVYIDIRKHQKYYLLEIIDWANSVKAEAQSPDTFKWRDEMISRVYEDCKTIKNFSARVVGYNWVVGYSVPIKCCPDYVTMLTKSSVCEEFSREIVIPSNIKIIGEDFVSLTKLNSTLKFEGNLKELHRISNGLNWVKTIHLPNEIEYFEEGALNGFSKGVEITIPEGSNLAKKIKSEGYNVAYRKG